MQKLNTDKTSWDLTPLLKSDNDPEMEKERKKIEEANLKFINKWRKRIDYLKDPRVLAQALSEYENLWESYGTSGKEGYYFHLRFTQNQTDPEIKAKLNKIEEFDKKLSNEIQFFTLNISKIEKDLQDKFLNSKDLKKYKHYLERLFAQSKYLLSEKEEKILNLKSTPAYSNWVRMTQGFINKEEREVLLESGGKVKKGFSEIATLTHNQNKKVRDFAALAFNDILYKNVDVAEAELNSVLMNKKIDDDLRGLERPDLARHLSDDIESEVVDTLVKTVSEKFDIPKRYYQLKAKLFKVKKLEYHERQVEYGNIKGNYPYQKSVDLIYQVLQNLDLKFAQIFKSFVENGQIDVFPQKGKRNGAFCTHNLITLPTYILLNHTNKLSDVLTIAHELGHGINNELVKEKQQALNFGTPLSTAEVASTFMEDFVLQEILKRAGDETRLAIMMMKLNDDVSTIFRQIAFYNFETELHQKFKQSCYLSKVQIGKIFQTHMQSYMGPSVNQSKGSENWWIYVNHFRYFFYVYSYASGLLISKSLQNSVKNNPEFIEKVKDFLSAGLSESPKNIFKNLGIDITNKTFWDNGLKEVETILKETESLAKKLKRI